MGNSPYSTRRTGGAPVNEIVIDCIGLPETQLLDASILLGGKMTDNEGNTKLAAEVIRPDGYQFKRDFPKAYAEICSQLFGPAEESQVPPTIEEMLMGSSSSLQSGRPINSLWIYKIDNIQELRHHSGRVTVLGKWGDPLTQATLECLALWRAVDVLTDEPRWHTASKPASFEELLQLAAEYRHNGLAQWGYDKQGAAGSPRSIMSEGQATRCDWLQVLANSFGELRLVTFFGDWCMEFSCIGRYQWLWNHQQDRRYMPSEKEARAAQRAQRDQFGRPLLYQGYDDFVFMEFDPPGYHEAVNGIGSQPVVTMLPWDDSAQPLYQTLREQHVDRPSFCVLEMVVLQQQIGMKLNPPAVAEIMY